MGLFKKDKKELSFFQKIKLFNKIITVIKEVKKLGEDNSQLAEDTQKVVLNIKADIETLVALSPAYKKIASDIMVIINKVF
jgi:hypothetical protein